MQLARPLALIAFRSERGKRAELQVSPICAPMVLAQRTAQGERQCYTCDSVSIADTIPRPVCCRPTIRIIQLASRTTMARSALSVLTPYAWKCTVRVRVTSSHISAQFHKRVYRMLFLRRIATRSTGIKCHFRLVFLAYSLPCALAYRCNASRLSCLVRFRLHRDRQTGNASSASYRTAVSLIVTFESITSHRDILITARIAAQRTVRPNKTVRALPGEVGMCWRS